MTTTWRTRPLFALRAIGPPRHGWGKASDRLPPRLGFADRLHGAIAGLSCGVPSIVLGPDNFRISDAAAAYGDALPVMNTLPAVELASRFSDDDLRTRAEAISQLKATTLARYQALLLPWLSARNLVAEVKHQVPAKTPTPQTLPGQG